MNISYLKKSGAGWMMALFAALALAGCSDSGHEGHSDQGHGDQEEEDYERGPHGGRLLQDGDFALEVTIFEAGRPPQFRIYPGVDGDPIPPSQVSLEVELGRLGGLVDRFTFDAEGDYLAGSGVVTEPHSFDVRVKARHKGRSYTWAYESYEGRTSIDAAAALTAGIQVEAAGPATLGSTVDVLGRLAFAPGARATLRARFPGKVLSVAKTAGESVAAGEVLARIESNESLRAYSVTSPIDGVVVERAVNPGNVTDGAPLFVVGDLKRLQVDFHVFSRDAGRVKPGQDVTVSAVDSMARARTKLAAYLPTKESATQTVIARAPLPNPDNAWMPGMTVRGDIVVETANVPLAVRTKALQQFRDFTVVFAVVGDTYEVRMLELGRQTPEWTEVLGGLEAGEVYVTENSFLIKADIEKSGASHDH